jgi:hypothetical protein
MAQVHDERSVVITRQIHARVIKVLGHDLKIVIPEYDLIDSSIAVHEEAASQKMLVRVDFILEPNGLK